MQTDRFSPLVQFVSRYVDISENDFSAILPLIDIVTLQKGDVFIAEGEVASKIAFTSSGYLRVSYNHDGEEITRDITPLHSFATALPSFITQKPSYEIVTAITDCELLVIKKDDLDNLYNSYPKWERLGRRIIEDMFVEAQHRLYLFITEPAEVRYKRLVEQHPDMLHEVPLKYIADYLGVKLQSLSRLRRNLEW